MDRVWQVRWVKLTVTGRKKKIRRDYAVIAASGEEAVKMVQDDQADFSGEWSFRPLEERVFLLASKIE